MALVKRKPLDENDTTICRKLAGSQKNTKGNPYGRVYIFELILEDGTELVKVGMVNSDSMSRVTDRLMEVLRSFFMQYRYVPKSRIVKAKKFLIPYIVENHLHKLLAELKYKSDKKFDGYNELFIDIDLDELVSYIDSFEYIELLRGETRMDVSKYEKISEVIRITTEEKDNITNIDTKEPDKIPF